MPKISLSAHSPGLLELMYHLVPLGQIAVRIVFHHFIAVDSPLLDELHEVTSSFSLTAVGELDCVTCVNKLTKLKSRLTTDGITFNADPVVKAIINAVIETKGLRFVRYDSHGKADLDWGVFFQSTIELNREGVKRSFTMEDLNPLLRQLTNFGNAQSVQATLLGEKAVGNSAQEPEVGAGALFRLGNANQEGVDLPEAQDWSCFRIGGLQLVECTLTPGCDWKRPPLSPFCAGCLAVYALTVTWCRGRT